MAAAGEPCAAMGDDGTYAPTVGTRVRNRQRHSVSRCHGQTAGFHAAFAGAASAHTLRGPVPPHSNATLRGGLPWALLWDTPQSDRGLHAIFFPVCPQTGSNRWGSPDGPAWGVCGDTARAAARAYAHRQQVGCWWV